MDPAESTLKFAIESVSKSAQSKIAPSEALNLQTKSLPFEEMCVLR
jgi:hypothetical protein